MTAQRHQDRDGRDDNPDIDVKISGIGPLIRRSFNFNSALILLGLGAGGIGLNNVAHRTEHPVEAPAVVAGREEQRKKQFAEEQKQFDEDVTRIVRQEQQSLVEAIGTKMDAKIDPIQQSVYRLEAQYEQQRDRQDDFTSQLNGIRAQIAALRPYQAPQRPVQATE